MIPLNAAKFMIACVIAALLWWGFTWLDVPPVYRLVRAHNTIMFYQGYVIIGLAVALAWFRDWAAYKILWLAEKLHRWISALAMLAVVWAEGTMHILSIPHMEGWWVPILGGGSLFTSMATYLGKWRKSKTFHKNMPIEGEIHT